MKTYDAHVDVFSNLYERTIKGETKVFKKYHLDNMKKGEIAGGIWVVYSEYDFDVYEAYKIALKDFEPYKNEFDVTLGLEGLRNVHNLDELKKMHDLGIRHAMLTWNEENHLSTGVAGPSDHGLKEEGKKFLRFMEDNNWIVDVSHANIKSFYDILDYVSKPVIASHSCCYSLSDHRRNLNDDQLALLKKTSGYVGVNSARNFVSKDKDHQNIQGLVDHIEYLVDKLDIDHVMFGLDMMDFLDDFGKKPNLDDLVTHADTQGIIKEMSRRGFNEEDIRKVAMLNFLDMRKKLIGK